MILFGITKLINMLSYSRNIDIHWSDYIPVEYISKIYFEHENFKINFSPTDDDYIKFKKFVDQILDKKICTISINENSSIIITTTELEVIFIIYSHAGKMIYKIGYEKCVESFRELMNDLGTYRFK